MYYKIVSDSVNYTVEVVAPNNNTVPYWDEEEEPTGYLRIPDIVHHNGIDYTVIAIHKNTFNRCAQLTSVVIGAFVKSIGEVAFYDCTGITSVSLPSALESIEFDAFYGCTGITSWFIPNSVSNIGDMAFLENTSLTSIVVEEGNPIYDSRDGCNAIVETASNKLILGCKTTVIPNSVVTIGKSAFFDCIGMNELIIPNSVKTIEEQAIIFCTDLESVEIPNSVTTIGSRAFYGCGLVSVNIPSSVTTMVENPFVACQNLVSMTVDPANPAFDSRNNCNAIIETSTNALVAGCQTTIIPNSVVKINTKAFWYCLGLTSIIIPNSVRIIGGQAFYHCSNLVSITLPSSVFKVDDRAFNYCENLQSIYAKRSNCPTSNSNILFAINNDVKVHIPKGSLHSYEATWHSYNFNYIEEYMLPEESEWWYELRDALGNRTYQHLEYMHDTLINDLAVKVIVKESTPVRGESIISHEYVYEDSCRLYWWDRAHETFEVLYDYSAQQGEEWQVSLGEDIITVHVDTVMAMTLGDAEYDVMRVHDDHGGVMRGDIICGVGHTKSFFPKTGSLPWGSAADGLRCFWKDENLLFQFGDDDCDAILLVDEVPASDEITLYPNPTNGYVTITTDGLNHVTVFSLLGQVVFESDVYADEMVLDLSQLESGVYLVRATSNTTACGISKLLVKSTR